jgi:hypothetical protein
MKTSLEPTGITYNGQVKLFRAGKLISDVSCNLRQYKEILQKSEIGTRKELMDKSGAEYWRGTIISPFQLNLRDGPSFILHFEGGLPDVGVILREENRQNDRWTYSIVDE